MTMAKPLKTAGGIALLALIVMQFFRPARTNPTSDARASFEAVVNPPQKVALSLKRACGDCHSNETAWPWYSNIAPASWLIASDVNEGRAHLNLSVWTQPGAGAARPEVTDLCEEVQKGEMPLRSYTLLHPQAKLSTGEVAALCDLRVARNTEPR